MRTLRGFQFVCGFGLFLSSASLSLHLQPPLCDVTTVNLQEQNQLTFDKQGFDPWITARKDLQDPECCVVSVCSPRNDNENNTTTTSEYEYEYEYEYKNNPLDTHLAVLEERLANRGPSDIDIRTRIDTTTFDSAVNDSIGVCASMVEAGVGEDERENLLVTARSLAQFAMGMASFAEDCNIDSQEQKQKQKHTRSGVFLRIVCASSYSAHDPVFHTDKCPLRGYATLRGVGTEFVTHPCSPLEYLSLRSLGTKVSDGSNLLRAREKEFIVMKGDYYYRGNTSISSWWQRAFACVHRSPPGDGRKRVILSFDLDDGDDDREWYDVHQKRKWRAGMTQRKSKLVA